jgi:endoglucanase
MKSFKIIKSLLLLNTIFLTTSIYAQSWIRINQIGYLQKSVKVAVLCSKQDISPKQFELCDALTGEVIWHSGKIKSYGEYGPFKTTFRLDFSNFEKRGAYFIKVMNIQSPNFRIANDVYDGSADFLLKYMREQQCGYNPVLKDSCHTHDGFIVYDPPHDSEFINVVGGWHDAADYLQYVTTSANAVFQMLFAYQQNPNAFEDKFDANGNPGANGIPDILDEAKWGLNWLVKMNPKKDVMFNQIADDRDHAGFRLPDKDSVNYGIDFERPVYYCNGKPQGLFQYKNKTTGIASTAGKFASAFALGSQILKKYYPDFAEKIKQKAIDAYEYGLQHPGACQTAPCKSPYYYEEKNWVDDMELAAIQLNEITKDEKYLTDAVKFGDQEPVTPWMGADTARHYQWYPFINLGHYYLSITANKKTDKHFVKYLREGIERVYQRGTSNPFLIGVPFIWCSNNLVSAILTQCRLYYELTKDPTYLPMEAALRDWLFGCNIWGTSMIIDYPIDGISPKDPHSSFWVVGQIKIPGGLVDGPVYTTIFNKLEGLKLTKLDEFSPFQSNVAVYHDDHGDYSTNEPTIDGTASLTYYLSALQKEGKDPAKNSNFEYVQGGIIRTNVNKKEIHLVFTGDEYAEGLEKVRNVLKKHHIKGAFFFTGDFYRNPKFKKMIEKLKKDGDYLGAHSNKHLLYASWTDRDSTLVNKEEFLSDLKDNYAEMEKFGISKNSAKYFLPPFEWYNKDISNWCKEVGLTLVDFTPGTSSNQDWSYPATGIKYITSDSIFKKILNYEKKDPHGLNGFILLTHPGTDPRRPDKFYDKLDKLITTLQNIGYKFTLLTKAIDNN